MRKALFLLVLTLQCSVFKAQANTVVFIHGFLSDSRSMNCAAEALAGCNHTIAFWDYRSRDKFIQQHACDLVMYLQQTACQCPGQPIDFVCHSSGALILRTALNLPECPMEAKMGRAVLLAPPSQGSLLARRFQDALPVIMVMGDKYGWQIMHYTPWDFACLGEFPASMAVLVIAGTKGSSLFFRSPNDGFLAVQETWLNTPFYYLSFCVTHGQLLKSRRVLDSVRQFLAVPESCVEDSGLCGRD